ncbi:MAG: hypothetical protein ABJP70_13760 [Erythrobacter sp.]
MNAPTPSEEERAARRIALMSGTRFAGALIVVLGIAIAQGQVSASYWLGVALAVGGLLVFFVAPTKMVRRWKKQDRERGE